MSRISICQSYANLKRTLAAASLLRHYHGGSVVYQYYDHNTQQHKQQKLSHKEMLWCYISHISFLHFKCMHYYGFLTNRKSGTLLPKITAADLFNDHVLSFYTSKGLSVLRILTDRGTEYCSKMEQHDDQLHMAINGIDHTISSPAPIPVTICVSSRTM